MRCLKMATYGFQLGSKHRWGKMKKNLSMNIRHWRTTTAEVGETASTESALWKLMAFMVKGRWPTGERVLDTSTSIGICNVAKWWVITDSNWNFTVLSLTMSLPIVLRGHWQHNQSLGWTYPRGKGAKDQTSTADCNINALVSVHRGHWGWHRYTSSQSVNLRKDWAHITKLPAFHVLKYTQEMYQSIHNPHNMSGWLIWHPEISLF